LRLENPLGKIPVLILEDGTTLYDSRVILDYLDHRAGGGVIEVGGGARALLGLQCRNIKFAR
jgi:glutathione S-transferase